MKKYFMAKMSSGKRLAKRSIVGMKVCAQCDDGFYYSCRIVGIKSPSSTFDNHNCINITPNTRFQVRFDPNAALSRRHRIDFPIEELIGDGFSSILDARLKPDQRVYITHNGREISGTVIEHDIMTEEVTILVQVSPTETPFELVKKLEEVRLAESRRSPRLADQATDTDFARLADVGSDRRRSTSYSIDMPGLTTGSGSARKRRISYSQEELFGVTADLGDMSECNAALVLMSLSHSPNSSIQGFNASGSVQSYSGSSSPPLSDDGNVSSSSTSSDQKFAGKKAVNQQIVIVNHMRVARGQRTTSLSTSDEGIVMDYVAEEMPRVVKRRSKIYKCTWKNCGLTFGTDQQVKSHVRNAHLGPKSTDDEDFYYTDLEDDDEAIVLEASNTSPPLPPTLSHSDMARPPHEDPEYQRKIVGNMRQGLLMSTNNGQTFVKVPMSSSMVLPHNSGYTWSPLPSQNNSPHSSSRPSTKFPHAPYISPTYSAANYPVLVQQYHSMPSQGAISKLSHSSPPQLPPPPQQNSLHSSPKTATGGGKIRPNITSPRRTRGENKKCRKVYGMDNREMWCTQCKWKKACSRFGE